MFSDRAHRAVRRDREMIFEKAVEIVKKNGAELTGRDGADAIREKGRTDYVTEVDIRVQRQIFAELKELDPTAQLLGEEKENEGIDREGEHLDSGSGGRDNEPDP